MNRAMLVVPWSQQATAYRRSLLIKRHFIAKKYGNNICVQAGIAIKSEPSGGVGDRVLTPNVVRQTTCDVIYLGDILREEAAPPGSTPVL
jgi:hypothetical protein